MKVWPDTVPYCARVPDGHEAVAVDGRVAFQPDVGPAIMRRRTTAEVRRWVITLVPLTQDEFEAFRSFVRDDLSGGVEPFLFPVPGSGAVGRFQFAGGADLYVHRRATGRREIVSFELIQLPGGPGLPGALPPSPPEWLVKAAVEAGMLHSCDWPIP